MLKKKSLQHKPTTLRIKVLEISGIQGTYLNIIKAIYSKSTANIKLNREKLKVISLKSGTKQGCLLSPYIYLKF